MSLISLLLALSPILVILLLLTVRRSAADTAGLAGWLVAATAAWLVFKTPPPVVLRASLSGVVASLPIALVVATSILQITVMQETGAISRVVALIKTVAPTDRVVQIMLINVGVGTVLTALGAVPVSVLPPIMLALGYSSFAAIALPAIGYDALCTYALLGVPAVVYAQFAGASVGEVGVYFARYMPVVSSCIALGMVWMAGGWQLVRSGIVPTLLSGLTAGLVAIGMNALGLITLTGIAAGSGVIVVMLLYLRLSGRRIVDRSRLTEHDLDAESRMRLLAAISPWLLLTLFSLLLNAPFLRLYSLVFDRLAMPAEIIPGAPEKIRPLWQAYTWILVSTIVALPLLRPSSQQVKNSLRVWLRRAPRPVLAAAIYFAIAYVINHSGKGVDWMLVDPQRNMIQVVAGAAASAFGQVYPLVAPFLGLLGGFVSGSETSAIAMLTELHFATAARIGVSGLLVGAASGVGGGLASVISPAKLQNAAATIDRIGEESSVIRVTFIISLVITAVVGVMTLVWAL